MMLLLLKKKKIITRYLFDLNFSKILIKKKKNLIKINAYLFLFYMFCRILIKIKNCFKILYFFNLILNILIIQ